MSSPLFPPWSTPLARAAFVVLLLTPVVTPGLMMAWVRTRPSTGEGSAPAQPIPFDHRLHAGAFAIDCRYCHGTAETGASAGLPATEICVSCHQSVWLQGRAFEPVRRSLATGRPIAWRRVDALPAYVYFDHAAHTRHGVGCEECHGRVDRMGRVAQAAPLTMQWCLGCHETPRGHLRPLEQVTAMGWRPPSLDAQATALQRALASRYHVRSRTACVTCHR